MVPGTHWAVFCAATLAQKKYTPGDAGQVSNHVEEILLWHFTEAGVLWEHDDGGAIFSSPSCSTKTPRA